MATQKRGSAFFEAEKFTQRLGELVDALSSEADKQQVVSQLETLIRFLSDENSSRRYPRAPRRWGGTNGGRQAQSTVCRGELESSSRCGVGRQTK